MSGQNLPSDPTQASANLEQEIRSLQAEKQGLLNTIQILKTTDQEEVVNNLNKSISILDNKIEKLQLALSVECGSRQANDVNGIANSVDINKFQKDMDELKNELQSQINIEVEKILQELSHN